MSSHQILFIFTSQIFITTIPITLSSSIVIILVLKFIYKFSFLVFNFIKIIYALYLKVIHSSTGLVTRKISSPLPSSPQITIFSPLAHYFDIYFHVSIFAVLLLLDFSALCASSDFLLGTSFFHLPKTHLLSANIVPGAVLGIWDTTNRINKYLSGERDE